MKNFSIYPSVTIGILTKNSEETIGDCLASIINCDYEKSKMEIIVVDGGSRDRTLNIVKIYQRKARQMGIKFKVLKERKGLGYARQLVVENAQGEYLCWIDSDNIVPHSLLKMQISFIRNKSSIGIVIPLVMPIGKNLIQRIQGYIWLIPTLNAIKTKRTPYLTMMGTLCPLKVLKKIGGFNVDIKGAGEDVDLISKLKHNGYRVAVNPRAIIYHHMRKTIHAFLKHIVWYGRTSPKSSTKVLIKDGIFRILLYIKLIPLMIKIFKDPASILTPFFITVWSIIHMITNLCKES